MGKMIPELWRQAHDRHWCHDGRYSDQQNVDWSHRFRKSYAQKYPDHSRSYHMFHRIKLPPKLRRLVVFPMV
jgi:hypothetical protein